MPYRLLKLAEGHGKSDSSLTIFRCFYSLAREKPYSLQWRQKQRGPSTEEVKKKAQRQSKSRMYS